MARSEGGTWVKQRRLRRDRVPLALPRGVPWLVVLLACFSLGWPDDAAAQTAATVTVCQTGATYTTIQSAVTAAAAGDGIEVCAGEFTEQVKVTKKMTMRSARAREQDEDRPCQRSPTGDQDGVTIKGGVDVIVDLSRLHDHRTWVSPAVCFSGVFVPQPGRRRRYTATSITAQPDRPARRLPDGDRRARRPGGASLKTSQEQRRSPMTRSATTRRAGSWSTALVRLRRSPTTTSSRESTRPMLVAEENSVPVDQPKRPRRSTLTRSLRTRARREHSSREQNAAGILLFGAFCRHVTVWTTRSPPSFSRVEMSSVEPLPARRITVRAERDHEAAGQTGSSSGGDGQHARRFGPDKRRSLVRDRRPWNRERRHLRGQRGQRRQRRRHFDCNDASPGNRSNGTRTYGRSNLGATAEPDGIALPKQSRRPAGRGRPAVSCCRRDPEQPTQPAGRSSRPSLPARWRRLPRTRSSPRCRTIRSVVPVELRSRGDEVVVAAASHVPLPATEGRW